MRLAVGGNPALLRSLGTAALFRLCLCSFSLIAHSVGNEDKNGTVTEMSEHLTLAFGFITFEQCSPNLYSAQIQNTAQPMFGLMQWNVPWRVGMVGLVCLADRQWDSEHWEWARAVGTWQYFVPIDYRGRIDGTPCLIEYLTFSLATPTHTSYMHFNVHMTQLVWLINQYPAN